MLDSELHLLKKKSFLSDCSFTFVFRVSAAYGQDILPNTSHRIKFSPSKQPGAHVGAALRSDVRRFSRTQIFFLFFTTKVIKNLCVNRNKYAWMHILERQTYSRRDGSWEEVTPLEMLRLIGMIIYMGVVEVLRFHLYWRTTNISWPPPNKCYATGPILGVAVIPECRRSFGNTWRVAWLLKHINEQSVNLFQPQCDLAVDERMVKSKAPSGIRQYIRDKVTNFGYKLWVLADSGPGTDFNSLCTLASVRQQGPMA